MIVGFVGVVLALLLVAAFVRLAENSMIYFPPRYPEGFLPASAYPFRFDDVWLATADGVKIHAWYAYAPSGNPQAKVLLMFHGNAVNIGQLGQAQLPVMLQAGANIMAVDYRGYGRSEGTPSEAGVYRDAEAAWRYLTEQRGHRPADISIYGQSLGGAVAVELAARLAQSHSPCGGLIIESSFTSGRDIARLMFRIPLFAYLPKSRFDSLDAIRKIHCPVLIMHGTDDDVIPFEMGERLYRAANEPKQFWRVEGASHNNIPLLASSEYVKRLRELMGN